MGWAFLPPIQRQLAEPIRPLSRGFEPGAWASPMFTGSMTHAVADGAPHGLIDGDGRGLGTPVQRAAAGPELTLLPPPRPRVQRSIQRATDAEVAEIDAGNDAGNDAPATWSTDDSAGDGPDGDGDGDGDGETGGEGTDSGERGGGPEARVTVARTAESSAPATIPEPPRSLVRASPAGLPFVQRSAVAETGPATAAHGHPHDTDTSGRATPDAPASAPTLPVTSTLAPTAPADAPLGSTGLPSAMASTASLPIQRMSSTGSATPVVGQAVAGERPRLGFGPPLSQVPPTALGSPPAEQPGPALQAQRAADNGFTEVSLPGVSAAPPMPSPAPGMPLQRASTLDASPTAAPTLGSAPSAESTGESAEEGPGEAVEAVHPDDCADPDHDHPVAPAVVASAGRSDVVPVGEAVVPEPPISPSMRGDVAPLHVGGLSTSIQRSSVLPGPGLPLQRLAVRPAGAPAAPSARVVRVQRVPSSFASTTSSPTLSPAPSPTSASTPSPSAPSSSSSTAGAAGVVNPPSRTVATPVAASSVPPAAVTSMTEVVPDPVLQRSTTTGGSPTSVPVAPSTGQEALLDAGSTPVALEYAAIPYTSGPGSARPAPAVTGVSSDNGSGPGTAGPVAFLQRSASPVVSAPALRAPGPPAAPALVMPQRASAAEVAEAEPATIQREAAEAPAPEPEAPPAADAGAAASPAPAAAPGAAPAAGGAQSPEQAEAMARQLFPSLLRMLRGELVVDRERRGVRTDRW